MILRHAPAGHGATQQQQKGFRTVCFPTASSFWPGSAGVERLVLNLARKGTPLGSSVIAAITRSTLVWLRASSVQAPPGQRARAEGGERAVRAREDAGDCRVS